MNRLRAPHALFYPFHLCHPDTLARLLTRFASVHFRDFMALQLTPMSGMTAFQERMGLSFPDLVEAGRLVQGYDVSGPLPPAVAAAVDRDLQDPLWRAIFHMALCRTVDSNEDSSSHPTVFVLATVSCQALLYSCASWTAHSDGKPMASTW